MYAHWQNFDECADDCIIKDSEQLAFCDHETGSESYLHWQSMSCLLELVTSGVAPLDEIMAEAQTIPANYTRTGYIGLGDTKDRYTYEDGPNVGRDHQHVPYVLVEQEGAVSLSRAGIECVSVYGEAIDDGLFVREHWQNMLKVLNMVVARTDTAEYVTEALMLKYNLTLKQWDESLHKARHGIE